MPYIGNQPGTGVRSRFIFTATASQTTFTGADDNSKTLKYADSAYVDVFLNGICLVPGTDYTASTKTSIVLTQAASLNDTLEVVAYDIASMDDSISKADGGTFEADVTFADGADIITESKGSNNTRVGLDAGKSIASGGNYNTLVGDFAGDALTTGDSNTAVGYGALSTEDADGKNTAIGFEALNVLNAGADGNNTAVGFEAGQLITTGTSNTLIGARNGDALTTGVSNVAVGDEALGSETAANRSVAIGVGALLNQNIGGGTNTGNTAVGHAAGNQITTGKENTIVGALAGDALTIGEKNVAIGEGALTADDVGSRNVAVGWDALGSQNAAGASC